MFDLKRIVALAPIMLYSLTIHEFFHAWAAMKLGDRTALREGRVSLNPLRHLDPMGTIAFLLIGFGWGKPVPVNPYNLRNPRRDDVIVSLAGPVSNIVSAALFAIVFRVIFASVDPMTLGGELGQNALNFFFLATHVSVVLCIFNLLPIPPLDGSHVLEAVLPAEGRRWFRENAGVLQIGLLLLVFLGGRYLLAITDPVTRSLLGI